MSFWSWAKKKKEQVKTLFRRPTPAPRKAAQSQSRATHTPQPSAKIVPPSPPPPAGHKEHGSGLKQVAKAAGKTLKKMLSFKKATDKKYGSQEVGQIVNPCVPTRRKGPPCDLSELVIVEKGGRKEKGRKVVYARAGKANKGHLVSGKIFGVVAGAASSEPNTTLEVEVRTNIKYCGNHGHPLLVVDPMNMPATTHKAL